MHCVHTCGWSPQCMPIETVTPEEHKKLCTKYNLSEDSNQFSVGST